MDISFVGMIILLLFITAGPLFLLLLFVAFLYSKYEKKPFKKTILPILIIFIPVHSIILFLLNPAMSIDSNKIIESIFISCIYVSPGLLFFAVKNHRRTLVKLFKDFFR